MKLADLNARLYSIGGPGIFDSNGKPAPVRDGIGVIMDCPCGCDRLLAVPFSNPLDGGAPADPTAWQRTGNTVDTLTLSPSVWRRGEGSCGWHGWIRGGEAVAC